MRRLYKILLGVFALVVLLIAGASVGVRLYFTKDRVRKLVIPPAEKALGRKVDFEDVNVGLFSGVVVRGFTVKEADGRKDFLRVGRFVLKYKLLPLLGKRLVITRVALVDPYVHIYRGKDGHFNYESLGVLSKRAGSKKTTKSKTSMALALTVDSVDVKNAHLVFEDAKGQLPRVDARSNVRLSVSIADGAISYSGVADLVAHLLYGREKLKIRGKYTFDTKNLGYKTTLSLRDQKITLEGEVSDYTRRPVVALNLYSPMIDVKRLMALKAEGAGKPAESAAKSGVRSKKGKAVKALPVAEARGKVRVDRILYGKVEVKNLDVDYLFKDGILKISPAKADLFGGGVLFSGAFSLLRDPISYSGNVKILSVSLESLSKTLSGADLASGIFNARMDFLGSGTDLERAKRTLSASGNFTVKNLGVKRLKIFDAIAKAVMLKELASSSFDEAKGNFRVEKGRLILSSSFAGKKLSIDAKGYVGLDGSLNMPLVIKLSPDLSAKLTKRVPYAKYLKRKRGWLVVPVKLKGTVDRPVPIPEIKKMIRLPLF